ncbi:MULTISPECIES: hypothetical protein [Acinetobacter]|uniref:Uncharacterized protein n=1 Tax=Acinetobacter piscicola TaxID=2006115 RepID=A0A7S6VVZ9_9GAMM|nr:MULTISPECIES: hypothetical protein [Acinetobacter]QOW45840.1 hypothetical protein G0028_08010 [Acinetobacter piscicola]
MEKFQFTDFEIRTLLSGSAITDQYPWNTNNEETIENFCLNICGDIERKTECLSEKEFNDYGSGYASFYDTWFYKEKASFKFPNSPYPNQHFYGLVILFSKLSPYYVFMQGEKGWHDKSGFSYMPDSNMVDNLKSWAINDLANQVEPILASYGLIRLTHEQLNTTLIGKWEIPTILNIGEQFTLFDALFYWED